MKKFSDFNLPRSDHFVGDKIEMTKILNREIIVLGFKIEQSKFSKNKSGNCLHIQVELDGVKHVVFTGSDVLIGQIQQVPAGGIPFSATITKSQKYFEFT
jgi:hypothetical protein